MRTLPMANAVAISARSWRHRTNQTAAVPAAIRPIRGSHFRNLVIPIHYLLTARDADDGVAVIVGPHTGDCCSLILSKGAGKEHVTLKQQFPMTDCPALC